jgi:hypothetical protein
VNAGGRGSLRWQHPEPLIEAGGAPLLHALSLESSLHAETGPLAAGFSARRASRAGSENLLSFKSLAASVDLSLNADLHEGRLYAGGGYALTLPLFERALQLDDSYHEGLTGELERTVARSSKIALQGERAEARLGFDLQWDADELERSWRSSLALQPQESLRAEAALYLTSTADDPRFALRDLPSRFGSSYPLYLPIYTAGSGPVRSLRAEGSTELSGEELSLNLSQTLTARTESAEEYLLSSGSSFNADLFFSGGSGGGTGGQYNLGFSRIFNSTAGHSGSLDYPGDAERSLGRVGAQHYLWLAVPVWELWRPETRSAFEAATGAYASGSYRTELAAGYSRTPGSTLGHLLLPGYLQASAARVIERERETVRDTLHLDSTLRATALNLFGRLGRYPLFPWYRTEEISHSFGYGASLPLSGGREEEVQHRTVVQQYIELQIARENSLRWEGRWDLDLPEGNWELSLSADWEHSPGRVPFPAFLELLEDAGKPKLVHTEALDFLILESPEQARHELRPLFRHTTEFRFDETGAIGLTAAAGYMRRSSGSGGPTLHSFGGELGITADFTF